MTVIALTNSIPFGILEMLSELGRHNKNSQLQAIRTKRLHTLYELNYIYCKSAFNATVIPFLNNCETSKVEPSVENLYKFVEKSPNLLYQARFRALLSLNIPCIVKGRVQLKNVKNSRIKRIKNVRYIYFMIKNPFGFNLLYFGK